MSERKLTQEEIIRAWRRLFLDNTGQLLPNGEIVMRDLEHKCGWMVASLPVGNDGHTDALALAASVERRGVYAHVKKRLFGKVEE